MKKIILLFIIISTLTSCRSLNPSQMLLTSKNYKTTELPTNQNTEEYKIAINDQLSFQLFTNNGEKILDPMMESSTNIGSSTNAGLSYLVEFDGKVKLPVIDRILLSGLTIREAEKLLEEKYATFYKLPFVQLKVTNNRVIVFPGGQNGSAKVVPLTNSNTSLVEAIALSGGIGDGKSKRIKLIRGNSQNPQVYLINLSTLDGYKKGNMILQANDIIYVESRDRIPQKILENITPYLSLVSTVLVVYSIFK